MKHILTGLLLSLSVLTAQAAEKAAHAEEPKEVSGMSILGNNDAPKSLYIVPWKSSEIGMETKLTSNLLDEGLTPVDKPVFQRELEFYRISNP